MILRKEVGMGEHSVDIKQALPSKPLVSCERSPQKVQKGYQPRGTTKHCLGTGYAYHVSEGIPEWQPRDVPDSLLASIKKSTLEALATVPQNMSEQETSWLLFAMFTTIITGIEDSITMEVHSEHRLRSDDERVDFKGKADYFFHDEHFVCLLEIKTAGSLFHQHDMDPLSQEGIPQALMGMEIVNTLNEGKLMKGILSDYCSWVFMNLEYSEDNSKIAKIIFTKEVLVSEYSNVLSDDALTRVVGSILAVLQEPERN
ncbi:unnamed protein product [Phytophthora lilii]|uniref:Unnamed protein product n=1 Tax=Phytophthora lilii TaxID=2077276 RepID=A0A9W6TFL4_9STRA|nr:unnamed protein product [Phytophthora lilii]